MLWNTAILFFCVLGISLLEYSGWRKKIHCFNLIKEHPVFALKDDLMLTTFRVSQDYDQFSSEENGHSEDMVVVVDEDEYTTEKTADGIIIYKDDGTVQITSEGVNIIPYHMSENVDGDTAENYAPDEVPSDEDTLIDQIDKLRAELQDLSEMLTPLEQQLDEGVRDTFLIGMLFTLILVILMAYFTELYDQYIGTTGSDNITEGTLEKCTFCAGKYEFKPQQSSQSETDLPVLVSDV